MFGFPFENFSYLKDVSTGDFYCCLDIGDASCVDKGCERSKAKHKAVSQDTSVMFLPY